MAQSDELLIVILLWLNKIECVRWHKCVYEYLYDVRHG